MFFLGSLVGLSLSFFLIKLSACALVSSRNIQNAIEPCGSGQNSRFEGAWSTIGVLAQRGIAGRTSWC